MCVCVFVYVCIYIYIFEQFNIVQINNAIHKS